MAKKQIIVCSPQLGLDPNSFLGGEVHDVNLIDQLCKKGIKCLVLLPKGRKYKKQTNLKVKYLSIQPIVPPHFFNFFVLPYLFKTYKQTKFDILRLHNPYFLGFGGAIFKFFHPEIKIVTTIHLAETRSDFHLIFNITKNIYDHFFTVSEYLKKWLIKRYKIDPSKITVIYNGVDPSLKPKPKDPKLVKKYNIEDKIVLLNMGLLIDRKNVLFLIKILKNLSVLYPNLVLFYVGKGNLKSEILKLSQKLSLKEKVLVHDSVTGKLKQKMFNLADLFLFPSTNEGFGLVAAEAMACGKVVIGSNNSSIPEVIKPGTGLLAKTNNLADWTDKVELLLRNKQLKVKMEREAYLVAKKEFSWQKVSQRTINIFELLTK